MRSTGAPPNWTSYVSIAGADAAVARALQDRSVPLHASSAGKAFLAFLADEERDALLVRTLERYTRSTVVDRRRLEKKELEAVRRDGYCVCVGELEEALVGAAAPVLDRHGRPLAVVSVWGSGHRIPRPRRAALGRRTVQAANDIGARLQ
jgi:DNA-binding IclR family transcriptional regulator